MTRWLRLAGPPAIHLIRDATALPLLPAGEQRHALLLSLGTLRASVGGESGNLAAVLDDSSGQCRRLFAAPPLGLAAELRDAAGVLFAGVVTAVRLGQGQCTIEVQA